MLDRQLKSVRTFARHSFEVTSVEWMLVQNCVSNGSMSGGLSVDDEGEWVYQKRLLPKACLLDKAGRVGGRAPPPEWPRFIYPRTLVAGRCD